MSIREGDVVTFKGFETPMTVERVDSYGIATLVWFSIDDEGEWGSLNRTRAVVDTLVHSTGTKIDMLQMLLMDPYLKRLIVYMSKQKRKP